MRKVKPLFKDELDSLEHHYLDRWHKSPTKHNAKYLLSFILMRYGLLGLRSLETVVPNDILFRQTDGYWIVFSELNRQVERRGLPVPSNLSTTLDEIRKRVPDVWNKPLKINRQTFAYNLRKLLNHINANSGDYSPKSIVYGGRLEYYDRWRNHRLTKSWWCRLFGFKDPKTLCSFLKQVKCFVE